MALSILVLIFVDVEVEVNHVNEGIGHLAHLMLSATDGDPKKDGLLLVAVEEKLRREDHSRVKYPLGVKLGDSCTVFARLLDGCLEETLDIDQGSDGQLGGRIFETPDVELYELEDLQLIKPLLTDVEHYNQLFIW